MILLIFNFKAKPTTTPKSTTTKRPKTTKSSKNALRKSWQGGISLFEADKENMKKTADSDEYFSE